NGGAEFVAGQLGHILEEYADTEEKKADVPGFNEMTGNDPTTHPDALAFESKVMSELLGESVGPREDRNSGNISFFLYRGQKQNFNYQITFVRDPAGKITNTVQSVFKNAVPR